MAELRLRPIRGDDERRHHVTPQSAGWSYVGFDLWELEPPDFVAGGKDAREVCLVFVTGKGKVTVDGRELGELGRRMSPFDGEPYAVYVPAGAEWRVAATTALALAVCTAPGGGSTTEPGALACSVPVVVAALLSGRAVAVWVGLVASLVYDLAFLAPIGSLRIAVFASEAPVQ